MCHTDAEHTGLVMLTSLGATCEFLVDLAKGKKVVSCSSGAGAGAATENIGSAKKSTASSKTREINGNINSPSLARRSFAVNKLVGPAELSR